MQPSDKPPDGTPELESSPELPPMVPHGATFFPQAPRSLDTTGIDPAILSDLALKLGYTVPQFSTEWAARRLHLPLNLMQELLEGLRVDRLLEVLGQTGPFGYRYGVSQRGRERAARLLEVSGYIGPAPVSLAAYAAMLEWQIAHSPPVGAEDVARALEPLVLPPEALELAALAASSGRSLFLFGPPGNGKTTLGRLLHQALAGEIWIPHCIGIDNSIIRLFDPQCHEVAQSEAVPPTQLDTRWVRIRRPFIVAGGELTLDLLDLTYTPSVRYYEAPPHVKANGGTFLIDDFGRERVDPHDLLNRFITPLEHQLDYLSLHTGQKIQVPLRHLLIVATNLSPETVTDPAFLRRIGYRLQLEQPTPDAYACIFTRYAAYRGAEVPSGLVDRLLDRYRTEGRELRGCEPRDLIERARDICRLRGREFQLDDDVIRVAWRGYFGSTGKGTAK